MNIENNANHATLLVNSEQLLTAAKAYSDAAIVNLCEYMPYDLETMPAPLFEALQEVVKMNDELLTLLDNAVVTIDAELDSQLVLHCISAQSTVAAFAEAADYE